MVHYSKRENAFEKGERVWTVEDEGLLWRLPTGVELGMAWAGVRQVRLTYAPTELKTWRHKLTLVGRRSGTWTIDNAHFKGIGEFEDRSASFNPFVMACVEKVAAAAPGATARLGSDPLAYWAQLGFVAAMFALLAVVVVALPTEFSGPTWAKLGIIVAMLPVGLLFVVRSWPRRVALDPEAFREALPRPPDDPPT